MGKLAERLADPSRSGVYRVESTEAVEEAAAINRYTILPLANARLPDDLPQVVLLLEQPDAALLMKLNAHAARARERGECFFAAFVDPQELLPALPPLYRWK